MQNIQLEDKDYYILADNLLKAPFDYPSGNRSAYLSKLKLYYSFNRLTLETIRKYLKYYKPRKAQVKMPNT